MASGTVRLVLFSLLISGLLATDTFDFQDFILLNDINSRINISASGTLVSMVKLDDIATITNVICDDTNVYVNSSDANVASTWTAGKLLLGGSGWGCYSTVDGTQQQNTVFRKVLSTSNHENFTVQVATENARIWDIFDTAKIEYILEPIEETLQMGTSTGGAPWPPSFASDQDNPLVHVVNYNRTSQAALYSVGLGNEGTNITSKETGVTMTTTQPALHCYYSYFDCQCDVMCDSCYYYMKHSLNFTVNIDKSASLETQTLQLKTEVGAEMDIKYDFQCEQYNLDRKFDLPPSLMDQLLTSPTFEVPRVRLLNSTSSLVPDVELGFRIEPRLAIELGGHVDDAVSVNAKVQSTNTYITTLERNSADGSFSIQKELVYEDNTASRASYTTEGRLQATIALVPKVSVEPLVAWGYSIESWPVARLNLTTPVNVDFGVAVTTNGTVDAENQVCLSFTHHGAYWASSNHALLRTIAWDSEKWYATLMDNVTSASDAFWEGYFSSCTPAAPCCGNRTVGHNCTEYEYPVCFTCRTEAGEGDCGRIGSFQACPDPDEAVCEKVIFTDTWGHSNLLNYSQGCTNVKHCLHHEVLDSPFCRIKRYDHATNLPLGRPSTICRACFQPECRGVVTGTTVTVTEPVTTVTIPTVVPVTGTGITVTSETFDPTYVPPPPGTAVPPTANCSADQWPVCLTCRSHVNWAGKVSCERNGFTKVCDTRLDSCETETWKDHNGIVVRYFTGCVPPGKCKQAEYTQSVCYDATVNGVDAVKSKCRSCVQPNQCVETQPLYCPWDEVPVCWTCRGMLDQRDCQLRGYFALCPWGTATTCEKFVLKDDKGNVTQWTQQCETVASCEVEQLGYDKCVARSDGAPGQQCRQCTAPTRCQAKIERHAAHVWIIVDKEWDPDYSVKYSMKWWDLALAVVELLTPMYDNLDGFLGMQILRFFEGSTGVQFMLEFNRPAETELIAEVGLRLIEHLIETDNRLTLNGTTYTVKGSYVFHTDPQDTQNITAISFEDLCELKEYREPCKNGGTCVHYDDSDFLNCTCPDEWKGMRCEVRVTQQGVFFVPVIAGMGFSLLLILLCLLLLLRLLLRKRRRAEDKMAVQETVGPRTWGIERGDVTPPSGTFRPDYIRNWRQFLGSGGDSDVGDEITEGYSDDRPSGSRVDSREPLNID